MNRKIAPRTPPAETPAQALANLEALLEVRNAGWDRIAVRDIIKVCYGSTEEFARQHQGTLAWMAKTGKTYRDRQNYEWKAS
jgi:hypothetical protein